MRTGCDSTVQWEMRARASAQSSCACAKMALMPESSCVWAGKNSDSSENYPRSKQYSEATHLQRLTPRCVRVRLQAHHKVIEVHVALFHSGPCEDSKPLVEDTQEGLHGNVDIVLTEHGQRSSYTIEGRLLLCRQVQVGLGRAVADGFRADDEGSEQAGPACTLGKRRHELRGVN